MKLVVCIAVFCALPAIAQSQLVSTSAEREIAFSAALAPAAVSGDGRFLAWSTAADNLDDADLNGERDVYRKNTIDFTVQNASLHFDGSNADAPSGVIGFGAGLANDVGISADGRFVAFSSTAVLVDDLNNEINGRNIFVRDMLNDTIAMVSVGRDVNDFIIQGGSEVVVRGNGSRIAFLSVAEFVPETNPGVEIDVFVSNGGVIERVSTNAAGEEADGASVGPLAMSVDGVHVAFQTSSSNFPLPGVAQVYVKNTVTGALAVPTGQAAFPALNGDGCVIAYQTIDALVPEDTNTASDVYVEDLCFGGLTFVSPRLDGVVNNRNSGRPSLSDDGRRVVFESEGQLLTSDTNNTPDIYFFDLEEGTLSLVSVADDGSSAIGNNDRPTITGDGEFVVYRSNATNIGDRPPGNNSAQLVATPLGLRGTDLILSVSTRELDGSFLLDMGVFNNGPLDIAELRLTLELDDGVVGAFPGCDEPPDCVERSLGASLLRPGETRQHTGIEIAFPTPGLKELRITAASELPDLDTTDNSIPFTIEVPDFIDIAVELRRIDSVTGANTEQVVATVRNLSESTAEDVVLDLAVESDEVVASEIDCPNLSVGDRCLIGELASGAERVVSYRMSASGENGESGTRVTATVASLNPDDNPENNFDAISLLLVGGCVCVRANASAPASLATLIFLTAAFTRRRRAPCSAVARSDARPEA